MTALQVVQPFGVVYHLHLSSELLLSQSLLFALDVSVLVL